MALNLTPLGHAVLFGDGGVVGPLLTATGNLAAADFTPLLSQQSRFPQTERWPLPGSGDLHPLDCISIMGVKLPLAEIPKAADELDVSHRKSPGADHATLVAHGKKTSPVRIRLLLFRDQGLGYRDGIRLGKDWFAEWEKISGKLIAKKLDKRGAVEAAYPTLHARGCDSLVFTKVGDPEHQKGGFFVVELEAYDPRTVKSGESKKVKQADKVGSRANPSPQRRTDAAAQSPANIPPYLRAIAPPSSSRRGR